MSLNLLSLHSSAITHRYIQSHIREHIKQQVALSLTYECEIWKWIWWCACAHGIHRTLIYLCTDWASIAAEKDAVVCGLTVTHRHQYICLQRCIYGSQQSTLHHRRYQHGHNIMAVSSSSSSPAPFSSSLLALAVIIVLPSLSLSLRQSLSLSFPGIDTSSMAGPIHPGSRVLWRTLGKIKKSKEIWEK